jgi:hypothetical protein
MGGRGYLSRYLQGYDRRVLGIPNEGARHQESVAEFQGEAYEIHSDRNALHGAERKF